MRRGLMGWDEAELPRSVLTARLERLQAAMAHQGLEALILYTNLVRPAAVCWLTGFTPYWIESLLLVPRSGFHGAGLPRASGIKPVTSPVLALPMWTPRTYALPCPALDPESAV